jgi:hypothetical protein
MSRFAGTQLRTTCTSNRENPKPLCRRLCCFHDFCIHFFRHNDCIRFTDLNATDPQCHIARYIHPGSRAADTSVARVPGTHARHYSIGKIGRTRFDDGACESVHTCRQDCPFTSSSSLSVVACAVTSAASLLFYSTWTLSRCRRLWALGFWALEDTWRALLCFL